MEKRKSERVQFFQVHADRDLQPVWVFHQAHPEAILALLLDISTDGAQVLTDKSQYLEGGAYRLIVHADDTTGAVAVEVNVLCNWSQREGTLYIRNGLAFNEEVSVQGVLASFNAKSRWLRCELLELE
jgi:hypothetical protein